MGDSSDHGGGNNGPDPAMSDARTAALDRAFAAVLEPPTADQPMAAAPAVFAAQGLVKRYRKRTVVNGVSLNVGVGEIVGLLGPNGAGKTTSFYMMVGLVAADGGKILLDGRDVTRMPMHARARLGVGYLPQEASVFRKLSVADNIMAILEVRPDLDAKSRTREMERLLGELHIGHVRDGLGMSLSGGERRRTEIARALAANPRFILLDEPFAGVDPIAVLDIQQIIRHLAQRGIGVLITDHNVRETLGICNRAYILAEGQVIAEGAPADLLNNDTVRRVYLGEQFKL
jgi:lipopolysaccharide export system ATP-binding protein